MFSSSLDHIGPLARSVGDIALAFGVLQGSDPRDPICTERPPVLPDLAGEITGLRLAVAGDHFARGMTPAVAQVLAQVTQALNVTRTVTLPEAARARAAAYIF